METWVLGGLFVVDWSGTYDNLVEELATKQKAAGPKFEYRGSRRNGSWKCGGRFTTFLRPEYFQHNLLAFYHHAWAAITNPAAPTPNWTDAVEKIVSM
ncbi:hypothetical protein R1flu_024226 [Riccia fluitans]|uniref:Uncharacterized protein n=1 Tax=Riccia fluitans TaxID=41844 RepID=A0ABD1XUD3_9MARC